MVVSITLFFAIVTYLVQFFIVLAVLWMFVWLLGQPARSFIRYLMFRK